MNGLLTRRLKSEANMEVQKTVLQRLAARGTNLIHLKRVFRNKRVMLLRV